MLEFELSNAHGMRAKVSNYGATLLALEVPDREGRSEDITRGYDTLAEYQNDKGYFGSVVGRFANRIAQARFDVGGRSYQLAANEGANAIHGGLRGFNHVVWEAEALAAPWLKQGEQGVVFRHVSEDGDEGYPGKLEVQVRYVLTQANELRLEYEAVTDAPTVINLTNHSYFNLAGPGSESILEHVLTIFGSAYTPINESLIPTGEIANVDGTPFDFLQPTVIGSRINAEHPQLVFGKGYDHNWVLSLAPRAAPQLACRIHEPSSGRIMEVWTTEPGVQFYSGNFLNGSVKGKGARAYQHRSAFVLETQHFPDSPNHPKFPSTELRPGQTYRQTTVLRFPQPR